MKSKERKVSARQETQHEDKALVQNVASPLKDKRTETPAQKAERVRRYDELLERVKEGARKAPPRMKKGDDPNGPLTIDGDSLLHCLATMESAGTNHRDMAENVARQVMNVAPKSQDSVGSVNETLATLHSLGAQDPLEGLLMAQMVGTHNLAMNFMARAMSSENSEMTDMNVNRATKLSRTFVAQLETLNRHRGKGQQKVTVEHVTVNQGGQAMIGVVERSGGGDDSKK